MIAGLQAEIHFQDSPHLMKNINHCTLQCFVSTDIPVLLASNVTEYDAAALKLMLPYLSQADHHLYNRP